MSPEGLDHDLELLLEAATAAHRQRDAAGRILPAPAWADLQANQRELLFERQLRSRALERALHPEGMTSTAREVLAVARVLRQLAGAEE